MTIHFAAARTANASVLARMLRVPAARRPANDDPQRDLADAVLDRTLRHFARHGLAAAAEAELAEQQAMYARISERRALEAQALQVKALEMKALQVKAAEVKAAEAQAGEADESLQDEEPHEPVCLPSAPGNRIIAMPQKPRPLFGIYGDRLPSRNMW